MSEIDNLMLDEQKRNLMKESARAFARTDAAELIARQLVSVVLRHQGTNIK